MRGHAWLSGLCPWCMSSAQKRRGRVIGVLSWEPVQGQVVAEAVVRRDVLPCSSFCARPHGARNYRHAYIMSVPLSFCILLHFNLPVMLVSSDECSAHHDEGLYPPSQDEVLLAALALAQVSTLPSYEYVSGSPQSLGVYAADSADDWPRTGDSSSATRRS
ncbi:hypothetical protein BJV74DRAFT_161589 [Russula compacta]|nr:hypothetical protein BJV74DRAFT_161589 [Russula compacta]